MDKSRLFFCMVKPYSHQPTLKIPNLRPWPLVQQLCLLTFFSGKSGIKNPKNMENGGFMMVFMVISWDFSGDVIGNLW